MSNEINDNFKTSTDLPKKSRFAMKYIIFLIILAIITASCIYFTIQQIDENNNEKNISTTNTSIEQEQTKKGSKDIKYVINSYTETYNENSINITIFNDVDGKIYTDESYGYEYKSRIEYVQIDGLINKNIQKKINDRLKQTAYSLKSENVSSVVTANFSNILSVYIYNDEKIETINIDLSTGEDIPFEKLFVSSATINAYLVDALYETLAWNILDYESIDPDWNDMSKVDTSEYEEKFLMLVNNYNKNKNNLKYSIYTNSVSIYGLIDKRIIDSEYLNQMSIGIDLTKYINEIAMYKRFLTNDNIYEDESIGQKDTIVFTGSMWENEYFERLNYGKIQNNIFIEEVMSKFVNEEIDDTPALEYVKKLSEENKANLINNNNKKNGVFFQRAYSIWYDEQQRYFEINVSTYQATCSLEYFKNEAFLDYIILKTKKAADVSLIGFAQYYKDEFPNFTISPNTYEQYYINLDGEVLGNSYEEVQEKMSKEIVQEAINRIEEKLTQTSNETENNNTTIKYDVNTITNQNKPSQQIENATQNQTTTD